jgi:hypothetical protein
MNADSSVVPDTISGISFEQLTAIELLKNFIARLTVF